MLEQFRDEKRTVFTLVLIFVFLSIGIILAGWYYYQGQKKSQRLRMEHQLAAVADIKVKDITRWHKERLGEANVLFNHITFTRLVGRYLKNPGNTSLEKELWSWLHQVRIGQDFEAVLLLDSSRKVGLKIPDSPLVPCPEMIKRVPETLTSGQVVWADLHRENSDLPAHLDLLMPIRDLEGGGRPLGVLVLRIDPQTYLYPFLQRWPTLNRTAETQLVRREGNEVVFLNDLRYHKNAALNLHLPLSRTEIPAVQAALGREGIFEGKALRGGPVLTALRSIPGTPWKIVVKLDLEEVYGPLQERLWITIVFVGLLVLGLGAGLGLVWRHQRSLYYKEKSAAAEALRESEERFRTFFDSAPIGKSMTSPEGVLTRVNPALAGMLGYSREELAVLNFADITHPEDLAESRECVRSLLAGEQDTWTMEKRYRTKDGPWLWTSVTTRLLRDGQGRPLHFLTHIEDISLRKRHEEEIHRLNRIYAMLSQVNQEVVRVRDRGELLAAVCRIAIEFGQFKMAWIGWLDGEGKALSVVDSFGDLGDYLKNLKIPLDDPHGRFGSVALTITEGQSFISTEFQNTVWQEAAGRIGFEAMGAFPLKLSGKTLGVLCVHVQGRDFFHKQEIHLLEEVVGDISFALDHLAEEENRRKAEEDLRESEERYRTILEEIEEGYYETDLKGYYTFVNDSFAKSLRYSREELIGLDSRTMLPEEEVEEITRAYNRVFKTGQPHQWLPMSTFRKDGSLGYYEDYISCLREKSGRVIGFRGISRDVTERRAAEEKLQKTLEQLQRAVGTTIQVMATAVEARDPYTAGHQRRTTALVEAIAREMGLTREKMDGISMAAAIHDIGKLSVPAEILSKPTTLTQIEFELIKTHTRNGFEILKDVESPWPLADIVLQH
ncbi:MAG: PAS domain S-box protein, partial [Thermodesulfobacteriota bacterium]